MKFIIRQLLLYRRWALVSNLEFTSWSSNTTLGLRVWAVQGNFPTTPWPTVKTFEIPTTRSQHNSIQRCDCLQIFNHGELLTGTKTLNGKEHAKERVLCMVAHVTEHMTPAYKYKNIVLTLVKFRSESLWISRRSLTAKTYRLRGYFLSSWVATLTTMTTSASDYPQLCSWKNTMKRSLTSMAWI